MPDPKTIVKKIPGCDLGDNSQVQYDINGNEYIDCSVGDDNNFVSVTVRTNATTPGPMADRIKPNFQFVYGPKWTVSMLASSPTWAITPQKVAEALGGKVAKSETELGG